MPSAMRRQRPALDIWPGFVDALSALLIIIIFLLMVFTLAQFFLSEMLSGRNQALERLNRQVAELGEMLSLERASNTQLRDQVSQLSGDLKSATATRERLSSQLAELLPRTDALESMLTDRTSERDALQGQLDAALTQAGQSAAALEEAKKTVTADWAKIEAQLGEIARLNRDVEALKNLRADLEKKVAELGTTLKARDESLTALRDRSKELEASLSTAEERTALAQKDIAQKDLSLRELGEQARRIGEDLTNEQRESAGARKRVEALNRQLLALRRQLARLNAALGASEAKAAAQNVQITSLGKRLNQALASKVAELARYRSEFFGRLREALGNRQGIRIVGDRFVFQSEVLFPSAASDLNPGGKLQIAKLAKTLIEISGRIPKDLNWVLRVDGHTDRVPIRNAKFPSNWELSSARAIAVVKQLIAFGLPANRLVAAGFGEFQPLDARNDEVAFRRNRRIEFKLTQR